MAKEKTFFDWAYERAAGALFFGVGGSIIGVFIGAELVGFILGALAGWQFTNYKINRGELPLGGKMLDSEPDKPEDDLN